MEAVNGDVQELYDPVSILQENDAPASPEKLIDGVAVVWKAAEVEIAGADTDVSTEMLSAAVALEELPFNVWVAVTDQVPSVSVGKTQLVAAFEAATVQDFVVDPLTASI